MSGTYNPDADALPKPPWTVAALSQRDLSIQIPINFLTQPAISLTSACFAFNVYEEASAQKCISNLLAAGYRKISIDLYWDAGQKLWSFCPISVPLTGPNSSSSSVTRITTSSRGPRSTSGFASSTLPGDSERSNDPISSQPSQVPVSESLNALVPRASAPASDTSSHGPSKTIVATSTSRTNPPSPSLSPFASTTSQNLEDHICATSGNISAFTDVLQHYLGSTQTTLDAHLIWVFFNIRAAASATSPQVPEPTISDLPLASNLVSSFFAGPFSQYLYTPTILAQERMNLNASWYSISQEYRPDSAYYTSETNNSRFQSTSDGWPSEGYVALSQGYRLILGWQSVDPQLQGYNFSGDADKIFPQGYLQEDVNFVSSSSGEIQTGCFFDAKETSIEQVNSSWAISGSVQGFGYATSAESNIGPTVNLTSNLTACGTSPFLNQTLLNSTANDDIAPYVNVAHGTIWSWAAGEPRNSSSDSSQTSSPTDKNFRCAAMDTSLGGKWRVGDCTQRMPVACRLQSQPYTWRISSSDPPYISSTAVCPPNSSFSAPRTALENEYLYSALVDHNTALQGNKPTESIWVDFNSLDVPSCWVTGGPNAVCPYFGSADIVHRRRVIIPTVAAVIVLVVAGLTFLVKCNNNRRISRRRKKRAEAGWEYEGVPS
ncbi:MAG: Translocation protein S62 [Chaenotheca gracillima]|nr:MAG: Translocation protein S62 [Chaenotheca gracillima]